MAIGQGKAAQDRCVVFGLGHGDLLPTTLLSSAISVLLPKGFLLVSVENVESNAYQPSKGSYVDWVVQQVALQLKDRQIDKNKVAAIVLEANLGRAAERISVRDLSEVVTKLQIMFAEFVKGEDMASEKLAAVKNCLIPVMMFSVALPMGESELPKGAFYTPKVTHVEKVRELMREKAGTLLQERLSKMNLLYGLHPTIPNPKLLSEEEIMAARNDLQSNASLSSGEMGRPFRGRMAPSLTSPPPPEVQGEDTKPDEAAERDARLFRGNLVGHALMDQSTLASAPVPQAASSSCCTWLQQRIRSLCGRTSSVSPIATRSSASYADTGATQTMSFDT